MFYFAVSSRHCISFWACFTLSFLCSVRLLESCPYSHATFADILNKIQKAIDDPSLHQYSNLSTWVSRLDGAIEQRLADR